MQSKFTLNIEQHGDRFFGSCTEVPQATGEGATFMACVKYLVQSVALACEETPAPYRVTVEVDLGGGKAQYQVELIESLEGVSVRCPDLPGCHSQGDDEEEALDNIRSAILDYLAVASSDQQRGDSLVRVA